MYDYYKTTREGLIRESDAILENAFKSVNLDDMTLPGTFVNPALHQPMVTRSTHATAEMNDTITMIVALSRAEEGLLKLNKRNVVLNDMLSDIQSRFSETILKPVSIRLHIQSEYLTISADEQLLQQCFANLVDNAIKYSGDAVEIDIDVEEQDDRVLVSISDNDTASLRTNCLLFSASLTVRTNRSVA